MKNSSSFFENRECRYFPCHEGQDPFNCLFCYCPFYLEEHCPGNPTWLKVKKKAGAEDSVSVQSAENGKAAGQSDKDPAETKEKNERTRYKIIKDCTNCTFPHRPESYDVIINWIRKANETRAFSEEIWEKATEI